MCHNYHCKFNNPEYNSCKADAQDKVVISEEGVCLTEEEINKDFGESDA